MSELETDLKVFKETILEILDEEELIEELCLSKWTDPQVLYVYYETRYFFKCVLFKENLSTNLDVPLQKAEGKRLKILKALMLVTSQMVVSTILERRFSSASHVYSYKYFLA